MSSRPPRPVVEGETGVPHGAAPQRLRIEPLRRRHLRGVLRIEAHNEHRPWSLGLFLSELRLGDARVYAAALAGSRVVGFAGELFAADDAHITTVAVHPGWCRQGVATRLLVVLARRAIARGARAMTLEVRSSNTAARALYGRFGFDEAGIRKDYYRDLGEDAVIMWARAVDRADYAARLDALAAPWRSSTTVVGWPS